VGVVESALAGPAGPYLAILGMACATFFCRASGYLVMSRVRLTPAVEQGLQALPGCIVVSTVLPVAAQAGASAFAGVGASILLMSLLNSEFWALLAGLAAVTAARAVGF
jgi:uncharacterized membrane protein